MSGQDARQGIQSAQAALDRACALLVSPSPSSLQGCEDVLSLAVDTVKSTRVSTGEPESEQLLKEAGALLESIRRAGRLMDAAAEYHMNWARRLGSLLNGYLPDGTPAAVEGGNRLLLSA